MGDGVGELGSPWDGFVLFCELVVEGTVLLDGVVMAMTAVSMGRGMSSLIVVRVRGHCVEGLMMRFRVGHMLDFYR
jgi:hypothetical protein